MLQWGDTKLSDVSCIQNTQSSNNTRHFKTPGAPKDAPKFIEEFKPPSQASFMINEPTVSCNVILKYLLKYSNRQIYIQNMSLRIILACSSLVFLYVQFRVLDYLNQN